MQGFKMNQQHLVATILFSLILGAHTFSYREAKNWGKKYPECNGKNQSPIMIKETTNGLPMINMALRLRDFDKLPTKITLKNTGHTVEMKAVWSGQSPNIVGGPLHGNYVFEKNTFHWAQKKWNEFEDYPPSNQSVWSDMEMHMYFYKTDMGSFEKAQSQKDGLAVLKVPLVIGSDHFEKEFSEILKKNLNKVQSINSKAEIPPFRFASILTNVDVTFPFIFYKGSLDYPPCSESVTWFIYFSSISITNGLLNEFRKIKLAQGDVSNVRPIQALNNREFKVVPII